MTPLGPNWGWRERSMEIAMIPVAVMMLPFIWMHRGMDWVAEKVWNS